MSTITEIAILVLAGFVGFAVISKVPNTLHTPLMSGPNAFHGIVLLGGLLLLSQCGGILEQGLTGPRTSVRGNQIAAVGMAIAIIATLLQKGVWDGASTPWLILVGVAIGVAIGVPAALKVRMTAMPQMVALFNGVGGGAVALI